ncbi:phage major capsid protein [Streptomyces acidiscabies]|uniref:Phage major capsid protein n=1 Tax=Streptomyces acidiscabies TaxID=42234 RepID=A0AAP6BCV7_9ACTN|nr:phage major capsid protein [Streptomyces acidiscabies]MBZ3909418.1 phage major capsid protein [Streptomyces acidiscabies]MDX2962415.1 phage major capsid protein [Streptomyces acidiscabies]MDX3792434.1 phage major capsid protein [Streptomyces acidiscabies]
MSNFAKIRPIGRRRDGRPIYPIKGGAPTLLEQRDEVARLLADPTYDGDIEELLARADQVSAQIEQANQRDARLRQLQGLVPPGDPQPSPGQRQQPGMQPDERGNNHPVTVAEAFVRSVALETFRSGGMRGKFGVDFSQPVDQRAAPAGTVTTTTQPQQNTRVPGIIPNNPDFPLLVAGLLDRQTSDGTTLEYMRDASGPQSTWNKAAVVAEGGDKPKSGPFVFDLITTTLKTVAHWVPITRQAADDNSQLMGYINGRLTYGLEYKMDREILTGNGTTEMQGILTTPGIGSYQPGVGSTDVKLITVRKAKTQGELALYPPTAIVLNPMDWQDIELDEDDNGQFRVIANVTDPGAPMRLWGLTVVTTVAMAAGTALLGGFRTGATLWERQGITILMTDSHADYFTANTLVILAERRANVAVHTPQAFVRITFAAAT